MAHNQRFSEENMVVAINFDPDSTAATTGMSNGWLDMRGWRKVTCCLVRFKGTGAVQSGQFYTSASSTGSSPQAVGSAAASDSAGGIFTGDGGVVSNQGSGLYIIEANHDEVCAALETGRYVSGYFQCETATDEFVQIYILSDPEHKQAGLTYSRSVGDASPQP